MTQLSTAFLSFLILTFINTLAFAGKTPSLASLLGEHTYEAFYEIVIDPAEEFSVLHWQFKEDAGFTSPEPYKRSQHFGGWIKDPTHQSCFDTRGLVLIRQAQGAIEVEGKNSCRVRASTWYDPYTDHYFYKAADLQIDHVVPLKNAYLAGAWSWSFPKRCNFSNFLNYPYHLIAVEKHSNMSKGDRGPDAYLPDNSHFQCQYVAAWLKIKAVWHLKIAVEEANAIHEFLAEHDCAMELFRMSPSEYSTLEAESETPPEACSYLQQVESDAFSD